jgi:hypothetical protein
MEHVIFTPTLENDSFVDPAIAQMSISLWGRHGGGMTSAVQLLVRPQDVRIDESGGHPGELFVMVTLTREELREMLAAVDADWSEVVSVCGDPNGAPAPAVEAVQVA